LIKRRGATRGKLPGFSQEMPVNNRNGSHEPVALQTKHKNQSHFDRRLS
jgi:hypothetical protein